MKKYFKQILFFLILFFSIFGLAKSSQAADYYIAQIAAGSGNGDSCTDATAISYYTGSWSGKVSAGDTVHLCGTLTSALTIGASGMAGNPITIKFESGANFTSTVWSSSGAINCGSYDYLVIDGSNTGIIQNTANGGALANQSNSRGINSTGNNIEIKNLTIQNIFVAVYNTSTGEGAQTVDIWAQGSNILIHDNTLKDANAVIQYVTSGATSNVQIYNNTISRGGWGIGINPSGNSANLTNLQIYNNEIIAASNWYTASGYIHENGIIVYGTTASTNTVTNAQIYNNYIHGETNPDGSWDASSGGYTAFIFFCDITGATATTIYNNLLVGVSGDPKNGYITVTINEASGVGIYNNTIIGYSSGYPMGIWIDPHYDSYTCNPTVENNIVKGNYYAASYYLLGTDTTPVIDYNDYYNNNTVGYAYKIGAYDTLASWRTALGGCPGTGHECNSIATNPNLNTNYTPKITSPVVGTGANLTSLGIAELNKDLAGNARPSNGAWDIGAYQYESVVPDTTPPAAPSGLAVS